MKQNLLGKTGLQVSALSFGASALGGVFGRIDEAEGMRAVHAALDLGITYFDVSPAYGATRAETLLGQALKGIARDRYYLSTKVGKYTKPGSYDTNTLDYSRARIRASLVESGARLGTEYFDLVHLHDIEYQRRQHTEWALREGLAALHELKREGRIGAVSFGIYPMDLWHRVLNECDVDAGLIHNQYCLNCTRLLELLPVARSKNIGIINGSPFASGLLTERGAADWHPATPAERRVFSEAAEFCRRQGTSISKLALQFASQHPDIDTTLFSSANPESVRCNVQWQQEPYDPELLAAVRRILAPVMDLNWDYDYPMENAKVNSNAPAITNNSGGGHAVLAQPRMVAE